MRLGFTVTVLALAACSAPTTPAPEALFFERLTTLCNGEAYAGMLVSQDEVDADTKGMQEFKK